MRSRPTYSALASRLWVLSLRVPDAAEPRRHPNAVAFKKLKLESEDRSGTTPSSSRNARFQRALTSRRSKTIGTGRPWRRGFGIGRTGYQPALPSLTDRGDFQTSLGDLIVGQMASGSCSGPGCAAARPFSRFTASGRRRRAQRRDTHARREPGLLPGEEAAPSVATQPTCPLDSPLSIAGDGRRSPMGLVALRIRAHQDGHGSGGAGRRVSVSLAPKPSETVLAFRASNLIRPHIDR